MRSQPLTIQPTKNIPNATAVHQPNPNLAEKRTKAIIRQHFTAELARAKSAAAERDFEAAWTALQRAHLLGQKDAIAHTITHWHMLTLAWQQQDFKEIKGQVMPVLLAFPLTLLFGQVRQLRGGKANPNYADNNSIPEDIRQLLE